MQGRKRIVLLLVVFALLFTVSPALAVEEGDNPLASLGINNGFLIAQFVNFGLIFTVLLVFLWRPMTNMMDSRAAKIQKGLDDAAAAATARRNAEAEAEKILAQARTESSQVIEESRGRGETVAKEIESEARQEADRIRQEARNAADAERNAQLADLRGQVIEISSAMARRLIQESLVDENKQREIVSNFLTQLPDAAKQMSGDVEVISAMPLTDDEQNRVRGELTNAGEITFRVDPAILGGLIIRSGERVVDGSIRSGLNDLSGRLR